MRLDCRLQEKHVLSWAWAYLFFLNKNHPSLQIFLLSSEDGLTTTIREWQHSGFDLNASECPKRLKSQYRYVLLLHIVLPCISMYCPLNLFEQNDEPRKLPSKSSSLDISPEHLPAHFQQLRSKPGLHKWNFTIEGLIANGYHQYHVLAVPLLLGSSWAFVLLENVEAKRKYSSNLPPPPQALRFSFNIF